jgi:hypothetical protein
MQPPQHQQQQQQAVGQEPCCPICGARQPIQCPLFPAWASEAKVLYFFEEGKRGQPLPPEVQSFWAAALQHYLLHAKKGLAFTPEEVAVAFTRRAVLRPLCLDRAVGTEADARGETAPLASLSAEGYAAFAQQQQQEGAGGGARFGAVRWAFQKLVMAPLGAAWSLVVGHDEWDDDEEGEWAGGEEQQRRLRELREPRAHVGLLKQVAAVLTAYFSHRPDVERTVKVRGGRGQENGGEGLSSSSSSSSSRPCTLREACQAAAGAGEGGAVGDILEAMSEQGA